MSFRFPIVACLVLMALSLSGWAKPTLCGIGDETEDIIRITATKAKGATPIVVSPIPRTIWTDGKISRSNDAHGGWAKQVAARTSTHFVDFNSLLADRYESLGSEKTAALFAGTDHTHTGPSGAEFNADVMAAAIRSITKCDLGKSLLPVDLWLPSVFSDHMVLQRDMPLPVWGTAAPGTDVSIRLTDKTFSTKADESGRWKIEFPAMSAGGPFTLHIAAAGTIYNYSDVWVGEVWLCSGQSNMDFTLAKTKRRSFSGVTDWDNEVVAAAHPQIRMFTAEWAMSEFPQREVPGSWIVCSPHSAGDFSAVAYYFGRELQASLKVPFGLVTCAFGASTIEAWIREGTLIVHPQFKTLLDASSKNRLTYRDDPKPFLDYGNALAKWTSGKAPKNPDPVQDQHNPSVPHNGMAVTLDIGDEKDVHPRNLLDVGKRLARLALTDTYKKTGESCGPLFRESSIRDHRVILKFDHAGSGLIAKDGALRQFAIATIDRKFVWEDAEIEGDDVVVSSPSITTPAFVRYAWSDNPAGANLFNSDGFPAAPFRTDP